MTDMTAYPYGPPVYEGDSGGNVQQHGPLHERLAVDEKRLQALEMDAREVSQFIQVVRAELGI